MRGTRLVVLVVVLGLVAGCGVRRASSSVATSTTTSATSAVGGTSSTTAPSGRAGSTLPGGRVVVKEGVAARGTTTEGSLVTADGRTRTYRVYVPSSVAADPEAPVPLLVAMHGGLGWGAQYERNSGYDALAEANGFLVVYPDGYDAAAGDRQLRTWNGGACCGPAARLEIDDVGFIRQLIGQLEDDHAIDPDAVVATGHSNGGILALRLACEDADQIAAVGVQSSSLEIDDCHPSQPVSVLQIHGTADQNLPIDGGIGPKAVSGVDFQPPRDAAKTFAEADGCPKPRTSAVAANADVHITSWSPCDQGTEVAFVAVDGASHAWMGHPTGGSGLTGPPYERLDSSLVIWNFLSQHTR